ncbi:hypothetical protein E4T66_18630 [Sinimarinibacterium sp. CAU 1509]|uniref:hypothetical protein n=1 Tax=Sinimarinibacterium sp. CAU 1509 TaxID=2562283 RepID=UPI0010AD9244|nr:hypothetical protein [Sinimarinibacterium sp. CAU 1509]TJY57424.1 hypothetical protein E4T66_18630 [Sinimarinibacterium sp. CAU 1509]
MPPLQDQVEFVARVRELSVWRVSAGRFKVFSAETRGTCATVWLAAQHTLHVLPALRPEYMAGITPEQIRSAVAEALGMVTAVV